MSFETVVGLEIHAQLGTRRKMFCPCVNDPFNAQPNENICPICMGHPGCLPVPNATAVAMVLKVGLALGANIAKNSKFDRKHYFYPDLPKGYQISQYDEPLCVGGSVKVPAVDKAIRIRRIHLEEDTARLTHEVKTAASLVDFNRAGVPLMELVTEPDFRDAATASAVAEEIQKLFRYLGVSDADMEKGQMRVEANISVRKKGTKKLGVKVEVKNLNSFKAVRDAIEFEVARHIECLKTGEAIVQETRGWNPDQGVTESQRGKENSEDYRYFPEPDIPAFKIRFTGEDAHDVLPSLAQIRAGMPELPWERREFLVSELDLPPNDAEFFVTEQTVGDLLLKVTAQWRTLPRVEKAKRAKKAAALLATLLQQQLKQDAKPLADYNLAPETWAEFTELVLNGTVSNVGTQKLFDLMVRSESKSPKALVKEHDLAQVTDSGALTATIENVILENQKAVAEFKAGKAPALQFLVGKVMAASQGKASPQVAAELLKEMLGQ